MVHICAKYEQKWPFCGSGCTPPRLRTHRTRGARRAARPPRRMTPRAPRCVVVHTTQQAAETTTTQTLHIPPPHEKPPRSTTRTPRSGAYQPRSGERNPRARVRSARALCPCTGQAPTGTARWAPSNPSTPGGARSRGRDASAHLNYFPLSAALPPRGVPVIWGTTREFSSTAHAVRFPCKI